MKIFGKSMMVAAILMAGGSAMAQAEFAPPIDNNPADVGPLVDNGQAQLILVSGGCGPNGWRGTWGHCHWAHYRGWGPYGYYAAGPYRVMSGPYWNSACPPGYWRGPWGHCRDTPYHGPLPDGGYKP